MAARKEDAKAKLRVKTGDTVQIIAGSSKGAKGKVISVDRQRRRVVVEGVNMATKHTKVQTSQRGSKSGGIVTAEAALHVSNVMVLAPNGQPTRVGYRFEETTDENGKAVRKKVRVAKKTGEDLS